MVAVTVGAVTGLGREAMQVVGAGVGVEQPVVVQVVLAAVEMAVVAVTMEVAQGAGRSVSLVVVVQPVAKAETVGRGAMMAVARARVARAADLVAAGGGAASWVVELMAMAAMRVEVAMVAATEMVRAAAVSSEGRRGPAPHYTWSHRPRLQRDRMLSLSDPCSRHRSIPQLLA